ncbi:hypothetical protein N9Z25_09070 [Luminiphilus sp.]|nr:hypothetical protein [Luminiphilus sp.]
MNAPLSKHVSLVSAFEPALLPGDPPELFQHIYTGLVSELSRPSLLAETLCAQLAEAMLWLQRHQRDKHAAIAERMLAIMADFMGEDRLRLRFTYVLAGTASDEVREEVLDLVYQKGHTLETLRGAAMRSSQTVLINIDCLIDRQLKTIRQLQKSIAEVEAKPLALKRLSLQVDKLVRDAEAIDGKPASDV